jgi:hypothetical protein
MRDPAYAACPGRFSCSAVSYSPRGRVQVAVECCVVECTSRREPCSGARVSEVAIIPEFPRSSAGKILKRELREPTGRGREAKI